MQFGLFSTSRTETGEYRFPLAEAQPVRFWMGWQREHEALHRHFERDLPWEQHHYTIPGTSDQRPMPRLECWFSLVPGKAYRYSGRTYLSRAMTPELFALMASVNLLTGQSFNSVFCNLYRDGQDSIGLHADDETDALGPAAGIVIASLSLGERRKFEIRHRFTDEKLSFDLGHGDLLLMGLGTQAHYLHGVPKQPRAAGSRINLTFRNLRS